MNTPLARTILVVFLSVIAIFALASWSGVPSETLNDLLFGWLLFLKNAWPNVQFDGLAIAIAAVAAALFTIGTHLFLRWFMRATADLDSERASYPWKFSRTVACVGLLFLAFAAGTALVGITHQLAWTMSSPQRLTHVVRDDHWSRRGTLNLDGLQDAIKNHYLGKRVAARIENNLFKAPGKAKAVHSWITALTRYEQEGFTFDKLDVDKPWDHPSNAEQFHRLHPTVMHPQYEKSAWRNAEGYGLSHVAANVNVMADSARGLRLDLTGKTKTILLGQVSTRLEPWGRPGHVRDPALGINKSPDGFGGLPSEKGASFLMADGSVRFIAEDIDPKVMNALGAAQVDAEK